MPAIKILMTSRKSAIRRKKKLSTITCGPKATKTQGFKTRGLLVEEWLVNEKAAQLFLHYWLVSFFISQKSKPRQVSHPPYYVQHDKDAHRNVAELRSLGEASGSKCEEPSDVLEIRSLGKASGSRIEEPRDALESKELGIASGSKCEEPKHSDVLRGRNKEVPRGRGKKGRKIQKQSDSSSLGIIASESGSGLHATKLTFVLKREELNGDRPLRSILEKKMPRFRRKSGSRLVVRCFFQCLMLEIYPNVLKWVDKKSKEFSILFKHRKSPDWQKEYLDFFKRLDSLTPSKKEKYAKEKSQEQSCKRRCKANLRKLCNDGVFEYLGTEQMDKCTKIVHYRFLEVPLDESERMGEKNKDMKPLEFEELAHVENKESDYSVLKKSHFPMVAVNNQNELNVTFSQQDIDFDKFSLQQSPLRNEFSQFNLQAISPTSETNTDDGEINFIAPPETLKVAPNFLNGWIDEKRNFIECTHSNLCDKQHHVCESYTLTDVDNTGDVTCDLPSVEASVDLQELLMQVEESEAEKMLQSRIVELKKNDTLWGACSAPKILNEIGRRGSGELEQVVDSL